MNDITSSKISIDGISHKKPNNFNQDIDLISTLDKKGLGTNWDPPNIVTLAEWLNIASLYILILDKEISYYKKILKNVTFLGLLFSTVTSSISLSQLSITESDYPNLSITLKIIFTFTSIFTTVATGYIKINNIQNNLDTCLNYYNKWNAFASEISGQFQLPIDIRRNSLSIIVRLKSDFKELFSTRLPLTSNIKDKASKIIENKKIIESSRIDNDGLFINNSRRLFCCCSRKKCDREIHTYFNNRLSVYFTYQGIINAELTELVKKINESNKDRKISFRIEATKITLIENCSKKSDLITLKSAVPEKLTQKLFYEDTKATYKPHNNDEIQIVLGGDDIENDNNNIANN